MSQQPDRRPDLPAPFVRGSRLLAADLENVRQSVAFALKSMIGAGPGIFISRRGDKYLISAERRGGGNRPPFTLLDVSTTAGEPPVTTLKIGVSPGMVNNFVPTIGGTSLVAVPPPSITVSGTSGIIQLKATVDGAGAITALIVESVAGPAVTADTATSKYKLVGTWTASGGAFTSVTSILQANQTFYLCNGSAIWEA